MCSFFSLKDIQLLETFLVNKQEPFSGSFLNLKQKELVCP